MSVPAAALQTLDRHRVYIFLSRPGLVLGAMLLIILLGAINYDNALGYLLAFLLGGLVMVAMLHTYHNLAGLAFQGARARPVFAGERAQFECLLDNPTARPRLRLFLKYWPRGRSREARRYLARFETDFDLEPAGSTYIAIGVDADRRGWLELSRVVLHSHYPLGILRAWAYFESDARCLVYPAPRGSLPLPVADSPAHGAQLSQHPGADDFAGLRRYAPGDAVRAIAWKTLAKEQELMVKRFHGQHAARVALDWAATARLGDVEARLSQLTAWALEAHRRGVSFALQLPHASVPSGQGPRHLETCLRTLALYEHGA
ncbi:MAG: DUF58 domain-containing protein [Gammaproteobacteria bacterium]